jgi:lysozyme family protein
MADFKKAYQRTAKIEGGYTNDPDDNGNWTGGKKDVGHLVGTNYGITAPELAAYLGRTPTPAEMKNMPRERAESIFQKNYWDTIRGDEIIDQDEANDLFDMGVNGGVGTAILLAHRANGLADSTRMTNELLNKLNFRYA